MANKKAKSSVRSKSAGKSVKTEKTKTEDKIVVDNLEEAKVEVTKETSKRGGLFRGFFAKKYKDDETLDNAIHSPKFLAALAGELIGTFLLALAVLTTGSEPLYVLFGLVGAVIIVANLSGANLNPAITIGQWVTRRMSVVRALFYLITQVLGAMLAYIALKFFLGGGDAAADAYGSAQQLYSMPVMPEGKMGYLILAELLGMFIYAFGFARALKYKRSTFTMAFTIGLGFFIAVLFTFMATRYVSGGYAINPAVAVALEGFTKEGNNLWFALLTYAVAPIVGGMLGFLASDVLGRSASEAEE